MSDVQTQIDTLKTNNAADATALAALEADVNAPATQSTGDQILAGLEPVLTSAGLVAIFGADSLSNALTAEGYTVTPPAAPSTSIEVTDGNEPPADPAA